MTDLAKQSDALRHGAACYDLTGRTQIEITGTDRSSVLNGLCTNDIKRLSPGDGCEAFLTNVQGKTIGHVYVFCHENSLLLDTVPGVAQELIATIDRYIIREDATLTDRSTEWSEVLVSGERAAEILSGTAELRPPARHCEVTRGTFHGIRVDARYVPMTAPTCFVLRCDRVDLAALHAVLAEDGAVRCEAEAFEAARIEMGTPLFGQDVTADNLPQEVGRDTLAINFNKGCYLGQETVARIDALGHVNRKLVGLKFAGEAVPPPGAQVKADDKVIAHITSASWSHRAQAPLALAYVRRGQEKPGHRFPTDFGEAEVVTLPLG